MNSEHTYVLVAGEISGDLLAAQIIQAIKSQCPQARFYGIGGAAMQAAGLEVWYPLESLSVMGITEVLAQLPRLLLLRKELATRIVALNPTAFIGIDAPDFNLGLASKVKHLSNIPTVHVVSPSVWAWRSKRIHNIKKTIDIMLALFPFEKAFYDEHQMPCHCIGHSFADQIPVQAQDPTTARSLFGLSPTAKIVAVLPGSRRGELKYLAPVFIAAMQQISNQLPEVHFLVPLVNTARQQQFLQTLNTQSAKLKEKVHCIEGQSIDAMRAADTVLLASGTATLEAMLLKKPMVVAYKWHPLTHALIAPRIKVPFVSLPNLLAGKALVPELIQNQCTATQITPLVLQQLQEGLSQECNETFTTIHHSLRLNAGQKAADAILANLGFED